MSGLTRSAPMIVLLRLAAAVLLAVLVAAGPVLAAGAPTPAAGQGRGAQIDRGLASLAKQRPNDQVRVIVQGRQLQAIEGSLRQHSPGVLTHLGSVGGVALQVRAADAAALAQLPGVTHVALDPRMTLTASSAPPSGAPPAAFRASYPSVFDAAIGAQSLWANGTTGSGMGIAVLDSGVQANRDFDARITASQRFNSGASSSADQYGHGTWVSSIAAGDGTLSFGQYRGVAPAANVLNLKVSDDAGAAYASDVIQALGWVVAHKAAYNIRVVNLSFVSSLPEGYANSLLDAAVEMVWHEGIVVVVAAGNSGPGSVNFAPANDPYVITVGAEDDAGTVSTADDTLASFSSYGPSNDGFAKPDLVAPGRHIVGTLASRGAVLARQFPGNVLGLSDAYIQLSGTSAAAPVVSGAVALLLQRSPGLTPDQVKWLLKRTAVPVGGPAAGVGAGEVNVGAAAQYGGTLGRANQGLRPNALVAAAYLAATGNSTVSWDSVSWDSVSWDSVSWDSVSWDSVSWDSVSWDSVTSAP